jgi:imidazolonepropionase
MACPGRAATLYTGIRELAQPHLREGEDRSPVEVTHNAALLVVDSRIAAAGPRAQVLADPRSAHARRLDLDGRAVVPGLVDSHTHVVFAGDRIDEMARRAQGETYAQIAAVGGGIARSAAQLASTPLADLIEASGRRLATMMSRGTTTVEIKTGYGLEPAIELKQLEAIRSLASAIPMSLLATVLAHTVPASHASAREAHLERFLNEVLAPAASQRLARYCDAFVEEGAFTPSEARRIAHRGRELGLGVKLHVDQLHDSHGAELAAELEALSADHLEHTGPAGRAALAQARVVATILPGCRLFLGQGPWPNGRALRDAGCEVAVATDCNPGTSMILDLTLCGSLAVTQCRLRRRSGASPAAAPSRWTSLTAARSGQQSAQIS